MRRWDPFFQNLAVYGYFTGAQRLPEPDDSNIFIESYEDGWFWHIPLYTGWMSVGMVVDSQIGQAGISRDGPEPFLRAQIPKAPYTARMLEHAALVSGPFVVKDWSYVSDQVVGDGYILVGDAACFVDPLFSSGVHLACMSGVLAAAYVTTALKEPSLQHAAGQVYKELYYKEYEHFHAMAQLFYSSNRTADSYFWTARQLLGQEAMLSPRHAFIHAVAGQPPRGYERAVLEQGEAPAQFQQSVAQVEGDRAARQQQWLAERRADPSHQALLLSVPQRADGVEAQRKPVIADGEFVWGYVLVTMGYPEGLPCSRLVAQLVSLIDGQRSVDAMLQSMLDAVDAQQRQQLAASVIKTLELLYIDGTIHFASP